MSLDEFFSKKSKRKPKVLTTSSLLEKITDTNPPPQPEAEINNDLLPSVGGEADEWEPIQNDIVPDISELNFFDEEEEVISESNGGKDTSKSSTHEVAWKSKPKTDEESTKVVVTEPPKPSVYIPVHLRKPELPNVDSMDDFPTLDAVKEKPAKKTEKPAEPVDNSWTEVQRGSIKRREEPSGTYAPPALNRSENRGKYVPPFQRDGGNGGFPSRGGFHSERPGFNFQSSASSTSGWSRGSTIKKEDVSSVTYEQRGSSGVERKSGVVPTARPYIPPNLRSAQPLTQSNRFAQLDNS